jgi:hypothetical protein
VAINVYNSSLFGPSSPSVIITGIVNESEGEEAMPGNCSYLQLPIFSHTWLWNYSGFTGAVNKPKPKHHREVVVDTNPTHY